MLFTGGGDLILGRTSQTLIILIPMHVMTEQRSKVAIGGHVAHSYLIQELVEGSLSLMLQGPLSCPDTSIPPLPLSRMAT